MNPTPTTTAHDRAVRWDANLAAAKAFLAVNGRLPGTTNGETPLCVWIAGQRRAARVNPDPARIARLNEALPGWNTKPLHTSWDDSHEMLKRHVAEHGSFPTQLEEDPEAKKLGLWLKEQRMRATGARAEALDAALPGWRGTHPGHRSWEESLKGLETFLAAHGRMPALGATGTEKRLARWVADQRNRGTESQKAAITAVAPGWDTTQAERWNEKFEQVKAFHAEHSRLPRTVDPGDIGQWLTTQRVIATGQNRERLDVEFPGWHVTLAAQWDAALKSLIDFVSASGRLPKQRATDAGERAARSWLEKQRAKATPERAAKLDAAVPGWRGATRRGAA